MERRYSYKETCKKWGRDRANELYSIDEDIEERLYEVFPEWDDLVCLCRIGSLPRDWDEGTLVEELNDVRMQVLCEHGMDSDPNPYIVSKKEEPDYWAPDMSAADFAWRYQM